MTGVQLRTACEVCGRDVATKVPRRSDGSTRTIRKHRAPGGTCKGSEREVDIHLCYSPENDG